MDFVTRVQQANQEGNQLVTVARKDNLSYLWDLRNMNNFLQYFEHPRYGNQRTGLDISEGLAYFGGENGLISVHSLKEPSELQSISVGVQQCIGSILCKDQEIYVSVGGREFPLFCSQVSKGRLMVYNRSDW